MLWEYWRLIGAKISRADFNKMYAPDAKILFCNEIITLLFISVFYCTPGICCCHISQVKSQVSDATTPVVSWVIACAIATRQMENFWVILTSITRVAAQVMKKPAFLQLTSESRNSSSHPCSTPVQVFYFASFFLTFMVLYEAYLSKQHALH